MDKVLIISNICNKITNVHRFTIDYFVNKGYEVHLAANLSGFKDREVDCVILHHVTINRSPLHPKNIKAFTQINKIIARENINIIHCHTPVGGILGRLCGVIGKVKKIIYTAHGFHFYEGAPLINRTIYKWVELWLAKYTDALITMNHEDFVSSSQFCLRKGGKAFYIPGVGINTNLFNNVVVNNKNYRSELSVSEDDIIFIAMGDLIHRKNYSAAIKAIARVNDTKIHFFICGEGPLLYKLKLLVTDLSIEGQIHFLGFRNDIKELLKIADVLLFTTYQEGLPRSMMEAMSAGLPCIASKIRGNIDLIDDGKGGILLDPDDIDGFAKAIKTFSKDKKLRESMGSYNLEKVKKFDVSNVKAELENIYRMVLD